MGQRAAYADPTSWLTHAGGVTMTVLLVFRMPSAVKITGRTSTITNSFVNSIIPVVYPTELDVVEALAVLGMTGDTVVCAYCGDDHNEWDHLRPLVRKKRPTGFISEIANLVPACSKCNQSKSGHDWRKWIEGPARQSPKSRGIGDLEARIQCLERFEQWRSPTIVDFSAVVPPELLERHWQNLERLHDLMRECQVSAADVRAAAVAPLRVD